MPPAAPTNLTASPGNAQVTLAWAASTGATGYNVKRATTDGGPYTQLATATSPTYTDSSVTNGTEYFYVVSALDAEGEKREFRASLRNASGTGRASGSTDQSDGVAQQRSGNPHLDRQPGRNGL